MPKKLVVHAAFRYTDANGQRRRAFRGDTINVNKKDAERGERLGVFGTPADLVPSGLDEGVVDLPAQSPTSTPVVPLVSKSALLEAALRDRLGVEPGTDEAAVLRALDAALAKPQPPAETAPQASPEAGTAGTVTVNLPPVPESDSESGGEEEVAGQGEPANPAEVTEGQAPAMERPPLAATKERWVAYAVSQGMPEGEANAKNKADLQALYGGS